MGFRVKILLYLEEATAIVRKQFKEKFNQMKIVIWSDKNAAGCFKVFKTATPNAVLDNHIKNVQGIPLAEWDLTPLTFFMEIIHDKLGETKKKNNYSTLRTIRNDLQHHKSLAYSGQKDYLKFRNRCETNLGFLGMAPREIKALRDKISQLKVSN